MGLVRRLVNVLLILVMLGGVMSPVLAANTEQNLACPSCSKVATGKSKVTVVEINGIEKNEILAKALKNEDVKKLVNVLIRNGYKQNLAKVQVIKIFTNNGVATLVTIPFEVTEKRGNNTVAGILRIDSKIGSSTYAIEIYKVKNKISGKLYFIDANGDVQFRTLSGGFWSCLQENIPWWDLLICGSTCGACATEGNIWACLACAGCLGRYACYVGLCSLEEPWGPAFCASMYYQCYIQTPPNLVACAVYAGCDGNCP